MNVGYTEFSYGYAFTENLLRHPPLITQGAPVFPNLVQEAKLGYDIKIKRPGLPLFFQFKLPQIFHSHLAREYASGQCPGLNLPYFRIGLMRKDLSNQHAVLMDLERSFPRCVYYAAGAIPDEMSFDMAYVSAMVASESVFFSPTDIGKLTDNKVHSIAYRSDLHHAFLCSEPRRIPALNLKQLFERVEHQFDRPEFSHLEDAARAVREKVLALASSELSNEAGQIHERLEVSRGRQPSRVERVVLDLLVAREVARVEFGLEMVVTQPSTSART